MGYEIIGQKSARAILQKMQLQIGTERRWTTGVYARDGLGRECAPTWPEAQAWCLGGAFLAVTGRSHKSPIDSVELQALRMLRRAIEVRCGIPNVDIATWQDSQKFEDVQAVLAAAMRGW